eukprot:gene873-504_t
MLFIYFFWCLSSIYYLENAAAAWARLYIYIYIYIYVRVCCVLLHPPSHLLQVATRRITDRCQMSLWSTSIVNKKKKFNINN